MNQMIIVIHLANGLRKCGEDTNISVETLNKMIEVANSFIKDNKEVEVKWKWKR